WGLRRTGSRAESGLRPLSIRAPRWPADDKELNTPGSSNLAALSSGAALLSTRTLSGKLSGTPRGDERNGSRWPGGRLRVNPGSGPNPSAAILVGDPTV